MTSIKENSIKHCYRGDNRKTLLEASLNVLLIKFGLGATLKIKGWPKMSKMKMVALFGRKLIISASILVRKPCLGSKLGYSRSRNPYQLR